MANAKKESGSNGGGMFSGIVIVLCIFVGWLIWNFIMGAGSKGGPIVPVLMGLLLMVIVFSFERYFVISKAAGKGNLDAFMRKVQSSISQGNMDEAIDACDKQKGSVANAIKAALVKYQDVKKEGFTSEEASEMIHKEIEEATSLEMPMLEKHMTIISTLVSLGTLLGLLGTVSGMIKAFGALASAGTPDQAALATGISEALINTATGIATSALAIIMYNFFNSKIDALTYSIDEAGTAIVNTYRRMRGSIK